LHFGYFNAQPTPSGLKRNQNYKGAKKDEEKGPIIPVGFKPFNACKVRFA
jgi:hypothetical protein